MDLTSPLTREEIAATTARISSAIVRTPLVRSEAGVALKLEALQPFGSYKIRGATNAIKARLERGLAIDKVVSASAGNFGQAIAAAARRLDLPCLIHAPRDAARVKIARLHELGAEVREHSYNEWWRIMSGGHEDEPGTFFHPVCDRDVIGGAATIGPEITESFPDVETLFAPIGGGGLMCGAAQGLRLDRPGARIVAVEVETAMPLTAAFAEGAPVAVTRQPSFVDGMGPTRVLDEMWPLLKRLADEVVVVSLAEIEAAIRVLALDHHVIAEGAGAAAFAAALKYERPNPAAIVSGGNLQMDEFSRILAA